jgi:BirA family biotin operon repressor/biotin-[acetyl-CoA-carboxylase] ligase
MKITEIHFQSLDSTQTYAKQHCNSFSLDKITLISAEEQTKSYGRNQKRWVSPKGVNLYATFCFQLPLGTADFASLAMLMAHSLAAVLIGEGLYPKIKWPNDVQLNEKKVAGILCESIFLEGSVQILIGIGVNINMDRGDLERIDQPATSLKHETEREWNVEAFFKKLQSQFLFDLDLFKKAGFSPFYSQVEKILAYKGKTIRCFDGRKEWVGVCHSLRKDGRLNLLLSDGTLHAIFSGDIFNDHFIPS